MTTKIITIKKRGGGTRKQKVQVLKSGKFKFIKNNTRTTVKRKKSPVKRRKPTVRKTIKRVKRRTSTVAKRKPSPRKKKGVLSSIPIINHPMFRKAAAGVGTAAIGGAILSLVVPSLANQPLVKPVLALAGGGVAGVVAQIVTQGGLQGLGLGGGNGGSSAIGSGFA